MSLSLDSSLYSLLSYGSSARSSAMMMSKLQRLSDSGVQTSGISSGSVNAASGSDKTTSFLTGFKYQALLLEDSAKALTQGNQDGVFNQYTLGSGNESAATASLQKLTEGREFEVNVLNLASDGKDARFEITENGVTTEYTSKSNTAVLENGNLTINLNGEGTAKIYTGVDEDKIVGAMKNFVSDFNRVYGTLSGNTAMSSSMSNQYRNFSTVLTDSSLSKLGLSYGKDGLTLDENAFKSQLESDYEGTVNLLGGQNGLASRVLSKTESLLSDSVSDIMNNANARASSGSSDVSGNLTNALGQSVYQYMFGLTKMSAVNNYYTIGSLLNTLA